MRGSEKTKKDPLRPAIFVVFSFVLRHARAPTVACFIKSALIPHDRSPQSYE